MIVEIIIIQQIVLPHTSIAGFFKKLGIFSMSIYPMEINSIHLLRLLMFNLKSSGECDNTHNILGDIASLLFRQGPGASFTAF